MVILGFLRSVGVVLFTVACTILAYLAGVIGAGERAVVPIMSFWGKVFLRIGGWSVDVKGMENLPEGGAVLVCNHQSLVDIPLLLSVFPPPLCFLSKRELGQVFLFGKAMAAGGNLFIDRKDPRDAGRMFQEGSGRLSSGQRIVVFAEGRRTRDGTVGPFKTGAFRLALEAKAPAVPVYIDGGFRALPRGAFRLRPARLLVRVLPPLTDEEMQGDVKERVAPRARKRILAAAAAESGKESG